jgi:hypothetical protein
MKFYVGNIQGSMNSSILEPQEICVMDMIEERTFHVFIKLCSKNLCSSFAKKLHGIPPNYGFNELGGKLLNFFEKEACVLYVKGEQQAKCFEKLLRNTLVAVQSVNVKTATQSKKCYFHESKYGKLYCAKEKCHALKEALSKLTAEPELCFFHHNSCKQPTDVCRLLFGTGTLSTLKDLWTPACFSCQNPLSERDSCLFCTNLECVKFNSCVIKIENYNHLTKAITYTSGVRLTQNDLKKEYYRNPTQVK